MKRDDMVIITTAGRDMTIGKFMVNVFYWRNPLRPRTMVQLCLWAMLATGLIGAVVAALVCDGWLEWVTSLLVSVVAFPVTALTIGMYWKQPENSLAWMKAGLDLIVTRLRLQWVISLIVVYFFVTGQPIPGATEAVVLVFAQIALYGATITEPPRKKRRSWADTKAKLKAKIPRVHVRIPLPLPV